MNAASHNASLDCSLIALAGMVGGVAIGALHSFGVERQRVQQMGGAIP